MRLLGANDFGMLRPLTGLFLGAGSSYELGMPLVWELTAEVTRWLTPDKLREVNLNWRRQGGGHPDDVIENVAAVLARPEMHYEAILGYVEAQFRRWEHRDRRQDYHGLYVWLVELVYFLLYARHVKNTSQIEQNIAYLDGIAKFAKDNEPLWIFELNHDMAIECLAVRHGIPLNCGFSPEVIDLPRRSADGAQIGTLQAEILRSDQIENAQLPYFQPGTPGINLLKIHGGLDIFAFNDGKDLLRVLPSEKSVSGVIDSLRAVNEDLFYPAASGQVKTTNEIAYADHDGEMQFLRRSLLSGAFKFDNRESQVLPKKMLEHFDFNIKYLTNLVCIGYGFGDIHINKIIREWLEMSSERRIDIVGPGVRSVPAFLLHIAPQVSLHDTTATDYLDGRGAITRSPLEVAARQFGAWARNRDKEYTQAELSKFMRNNQEEVAQAFADKMMQLPMRDGELDLESLGTTATELAQKIAQEIIPEPGSLLKKFMRRTDLEELSTRAYFRWLNGGQRHGHDLGDWYAAEAAIRKL